jgi:hypothetical protein
LLLEKDGEVSAVANGSTKRREGVYKHSRCL